jgi:hypothetical protein
MNLRESQIHSSTQTDLAEGEPPAFKRIAFLMLILTLGAFALQAWWILSAPPTPGWFSDSVDYLILANFFHGKLTGDVSPLSFSVFGTSRFPPLFPFTLALGGAGTRAWTVAYWISLSYGFFSILTVFLWLQQQTRYSLAASMLLPIAVVTPLYFILHLEVLSESQFVLIMMLALWLVTRYERGQSSLLVLALFASLLPLSRGAGAAMLVALSIWILVRDRRWRLPIRFGACALIWLPMVAWTSYRKLLPITSDYIDALSKTHMLDSATWLSLFTSTQLSRLLGGFAASFDVIASPPTRIIVVLLLLIASGGWWFRLRNWRVDAIFLPIYLGLVLIWPYPVETARLLSVSMPIVAVSFWDGLARIVGLVRWRHTYHVVVTSALIVLATSVAASGPAWIDIYRRASMDMDAELAASRRNSSFFTMQPRAVAPYVAEIETRFAELVRTVPTVIPKNECVWTSFISISAMLSNFAFVPVQIPDGITDKKSARELLSGCHYLLAAALTSPQLSVPPLYPIEQVDAFASPILVSYITVRGKKQIAAALLELHN